ncbi:glycine zipper 2TM domain-containing protein [Sulfurimonas sp.]|uniref:glycine zipper 2TM domain-containing protein n=1 Tax=Sulfurimonas sp. TaxID=2022749 RepID=UPI0035652F76
MTTKFIYTLLASIIVFAGCATNKGPEYDGRNYNQIKRYEVGTVIKSRPVVIKDDGSGKFFGALIGTVLGSLVGRSSGKTLATLGGGLGGYYAGSEIGKANGEELTVELDDGEEVVVVIKGNRFKAGDRVKIIKDGNRVAQVDRAVE